MNIPSVDEIIGQNDQIAARRASLEAIAALVGNVYPNKFVRSRVSGGEDTITAVKNSDPVASAEAEMAEIKAGLAEGERPPADRKEAINERLRGVGTVRIAGRLTTPTRGNFVHLTDGIAKLQVYANKKGPLALIKNDGAETTVEDGGWALWQLLDHGDFIGVEGYLFMTNTGEVSVHIEKLQFLAKAMLPMPDKMHGIADPELRRRYRYADLIASSLQVEHDGLTTREVFERRAKLIAGMRRYLDDHGYIEVETPMLTPKATGAAAKPFETHHNALDITLYARIAPELYLKRLVVGGFEKVYELNRNFRNEGLSQRHNPEFTMLEFYCAYMDVEGMMDLCEQMMQESVMKATGGLVVEYEQNRIDFSKFERISMRDAILRYKPDADINDRTMIGLFDEFVEPNLIQPTFIVDFPKSISPLSKANPADTSIAERFELFINGMEIANGFSELNDPKEQYERFADQMKQREGGDEEAMVLDEDYIRALSYGMPPAAGIGIGIDRLVMLLTNKHSIRDVILFPHMRPERAQAPEEHETIEKS
ncbi:MAG: lysine--tRNA ligase [Acidobacteria bacterium]|nr:lysine--tRNA ligase [Acidobacteriota bacterium]